MAYTKKDVLAISDPYEVFKNGDAFIQHKDVLNQLNKKEKTALATKIILCCPQAELRNMGYAIEALSTFIGSDSDNFYTYLKESHELQTKLNSLLDLNNIKPHLLILKHELNDTLVHKYPVLVQTYLTSKELLIAEKLNINTPVNNRTELVRTVIRLFPNSVLSTKLQASFTLRRNIETFLMGSEPEKFFTNRDFNHDLCIEFSALFTALLARQEASVGELLASLDDDKLSTQISGKLKRLSDEMPAKPNSFLLILEAMNTEVLKQIKTDTPLSMARSPHILYKPHDEKHTALIEDSSQFKPQDP
jgi:hypothetical protein